MMPDLRTVSALVEGLISRYSGTSSFYRRIAKSSSGALSAKAEGKAVMLEAMMEELQIISDYINGKDQESEEEDGEEDE